MEGISSCFLIPSRPLLHYGSSNFFEIFHVLSRHRFPRIIPRYTCFAAKAATFGLEKCIRSPRGSIETAGKQLDFRIPWYFLFQVENEFDIIFYDESSSGLLIRNWKISGSLVSRSVGYVCLFYFFKYQSDTWENMRFISKFFELSVCNKYLIKYFIYY